ncbi:hypothetical protein FPOA_08658 [Fusarium poae]|uniref:Uncharacterized protein n=1 Tax=Fusarium poae TaxID=36050 RepID=A0A1B8AP68_FUSPO|nr:hypothetical protein FPOA_08658 [Fusarium poae]
MDDIQALRTRVEVNGLAWDSASRTWLYPFESRHLYNNETIPHTSFFLSGPISRFTTHALTICTAAFTAYAHFGFFWFAT